MWARCRDCKKLANRSMTALKKGRAESRCYTCGVILDSLVPMRHTPDNKSIVKGIGRKLIPKKSKKVNRKNKKT